MALARVITSLSVLSVLSVLPVLSVLVVLSVLSVLLVPLLGQAAARMQPKMTTTYVGAHRTALAPHQVSLKIRSFCTRTNLINSRRFNERRFLEQCY
jgi:hypothetical protein